MENQKKSSKTGLVLGLILGFLFALITVYGYAIDNSIYFSLPVLAILLLLPLIFGIISAVKAKKELGGYITFKETLKNYFLTIFVGYFISTIVSLLVFNIVDPDFKEVVKNIQIEGYEKIKDRTIGKMYNNGTPEATINSTEESFDTALEKMRESDQFGIGKQIQGFFMMVGIYTFIGLLVAAIVKKNNPEEI